jgi:sterol desaturase/sphingolipid hydroxylase (fatty acid hydroxylase superfamily)
MLLSPNLFATHPFLWPAFYAVVLYGLRYLTLATLGYVVARPGGGWGRRHAGAPESSPGRGRQVRRELLYAAGTVLVFGAINGVLFGFGLLRWSQVYVHFESHSRLWFWLSIPVMLLLHDTLFYWLHRAMHHPWLFRRMHRVHHDSVHPTAFTAYSFHPSEAVAEALIFTAMLYIVPVHPLALVIFHSLSTAYNVYGHCGREFYPPGTPRHWLGRWLNTSTAHAAHHAQGRHNYGLYFMVWDRWMGTVDPAYR